MKKVVRMGLIVTLASSMFLSACSNNEKAGGDEGASNEQNEQSGQNGQSEQTDNSTGKKMTYQEWEDSWESSPYPDLLPAPWDNAKKFTEEYTFRRTPDNVERNFDGKVYTEGWPITKEKIKLKVLARQDPMMLDIKDNYVFKKLEERTNIEIDWTLVPTEQFQQKMNVILASGDLPDIIFGGSLTKSEEMRYGVKEELLLPINDLIDKYGTWIKHTFEVRPEVKQSITTPTGNIYSIPAVYNNYHVSMGMKGWINKTWLDKLNLQVPTTVEEYYEVLKAFKTQDPNGNGKPDELPLVGSPGVWFGNITGFFMNPFIYNGDPDHMIAENGKLKYAPIQDGYKEGLKWLNKLYADKLFDSSVFTMNGEQLQQLGDASEQIVGSYPGGYYGVALGNFLTNPRSDDYVPLPPLKGPSGAVNGFYNPYMYANGLFAITKANKHPEASLRWADQFYMVEMASMVWRGRLGIDWEYAEPGMKNLFGDAQGVYVTKEDSVGSKPNNVFIHPIAPPYSVPLKEISAQNAAVGVGGSAYEANMTKWTKELYEGHQIKEPIPVDMYSEVADADEYAQLSTVIQEYVRESTTKFIMGKWNLDKDWDNYVEQLKKMKVDRLVELKQKQYDVFLNVK
ncbi:extracellular solute-binding protein [Paenibacillus eucommiae]|uniref:Aldouronate transport system substrate-binding protein n=1 Tax=Paenibacillus eucommiae TaxID=1355755 RepID=A0ABS4IXJ8_9BACL|nr:extracellular solute-binding protein [Paenibacillus eucommiae]MBP1991726.1 putative aldouronate transport system substrate-binding protein [Paenibacillus eucommiae]